MADTIKASVITDHAFEPRTRPMHVKGVRFPPNLWLCGWLSGPIERPCNLGEAAHRETTVVAECIVSDCTEPGIERIVGEDKERNSLARAVLCEDHKHVLGKPGGSP